MAKRATKAESDPAATPSEDAAPIVHPPTTMLDQVLGQSQAKRTIQTILKTGRIHHAWIFHGPPGVGKFSTATAFAAALLDPTTAPDLAGDLAPEAGSPVQQMILERRHPDLHVITKELAALSRNDQVRKSKQQGIAKEVIEEFLLEPAAKSRVTTSASPAAKVFIIDEAELLNMVSQNALLKTLEEPTPGTVIILVTSAEERLLPTIRSRAQRVSFTPLEEPDMLKWLSRRSGAAGIGAIEPSQRTWLLRYACGSPGAAEIALANDLFAWEQTLRPALDMMERGQFPIPLGGEMARLIDERAAASIKGRPEASKDAANKAWARRMLGFVGEDLRARLRTRTSGKTSAQIESDTNAVRLINAVDAVSAAEGFLFSNVNQTMVLENLVAQMCAESSSV